MLALNVKSIIEETPGTRTYIIEEKDQKPIKYKAGQFLTLTINRNGTEMRRSYSFSSAPEYDDHVSFTMKQVVNGEISRFLFRTLKEGSTLIALEPSGRFTFDAEPEEQRDIFLIAAGSGVTPVFSLLKKILLTTSGASVNLVLQNHNERQVIFHEQLHRIALIYDQKLRFFNFLSTPLDPMRSSLRLNNEILSELITDQLFFNRNKALFYICGPLTFMRMAEFTIRQMGFASEQIKKEIFEAPRLQSVPFSVDAAQRNIFLHKQEKYIPVKFPQSILDAALENHINIPYSCKAGICGTCVVKCSAGSIKMKYNDVLTDQEVADGLVLTCVGYAESDVTIEI